MQKEQAMDVSALGEKNDSFPLSAVPCLAPLEVATI